MVSKLLDDSDLENLDNALAMAENIQEDILRSEQAGIDVTQAKARLDETTKKIRLIKSSFFPNR
tara:strand:- start:382 stop:573 length:192 start_codon:yes stop_codon:yes gene_type:complete